MSDEPTKVPKCGAVTKRGTRCPFSALPGESYCASHLPPEKRYAVQSARGRLGAAATTIARHRQLRASEAVPLDLGSPEAIRAFLEKAARRFTSSSDAPRANAAARLAHTAIELLPVAELKAENAELRRLLVEKHPELTAMLKGGR